jgi:hypothetical protein
MKSRLLNATGCVFTFLIVAYPFSILAASAPTKIVVTFGGLNERSGVLFVAKDAGIFKNMDLMPTSSVSAVDR